MAGGFWSAAAHDLTAQIAADSKVVALAPLGQDVAEANESKEKAPVEQAKTVEADLQVVVGEDGTLTIPAVRCGKVGGVIAMKSATGGMQLHLSRDLNATKSSSAPLRRRKPENMSSRRRSSRCNRSKSCCSRRTMPKRRWKAPVEIAVPYTVGQWAQTKPVEIVLAKGPNVLRFTRPAPSWGVTVKQFTLTPVK